MLNEGWWRFYSPLALVLWLAVAFGEAVVFPQIYRDAYDLPLHIGYAFAALFPAISLLVKGLIYNDLSVDGKRRFTRVLWYILGASAAAFVFTFPVARALSLQSQRQMATLSLSGQGAGSDPLLALQIVSFIALWILGVAIATGLALYHANHRRPKARAENTEAELRVTEEQLQEATAVYTRLLQEQQEVESKMESQILTARNEFFTAVLKRKEERMVLERLYPRIFQPVAPSSNGKAGAAKVGAALALLAALLAGPVAAQEVFMVQDLTRTSVEKDFQGFGQVVLGLPQGASVTLFGSDGAQYLHGRADGGYENKVLRQKQALIGQGRAVYQKIQAQPSGVRDWATALAEILPRMNGDAILVLQGKPLYKRGTVDWDGMIPGMSWAFHPASPFGEGALAPAPVRFRAAIVFVPEDFESPNHRMELQRFWTVLLSRLNGDLALFTTDAAALPRLLTERGRQPAGTQAHLKVPSAEREGYLKLEKATVVEME